MSGEEVYFVGRSASEKVRRACGGDGPVLGEKAIQEGPARQLHGGGDEQGEGLAYAKPTFSSASVISETLYADKIDYFFPAVARKKFLPPPQSSGIWIIGNDGPTRTLENSAPLISRLGCADDAIANFPPTLDAGPRRRLRRGPSAADEVLDM